MWEPGNRKAKTLPDALKFILRDKRGVDGSRRKFDCGDIGYLNGLVDAGVEGAQELIDLIERYEVVDLWLQ